MRCDAVRMACLAVYITFTIAFRIGSEYPFIERLVLVKNVFLTTSKRYVNV